MTQETIKRGKIGDKKNTVRTYTEFKDYKGRKYTGMKVGRSHKWYYDKGEWNEKKTTPDQWDFTFSVDKKKSRTGS